MGIHCWKPKFSCVPTTVRDKMIEKLKLPVGSPTEEFFLDRIFLKVDSQEN
jgi:hypothetical protein